MKKVIKNNYKLIIGIILGAILISGISVYATAEYFANEIKYTKGETETTVASALNNLYTISSTYKNLDTETSATADKILNGYTAYNNDGTLVTGSYNPITTTKGTEWNYGESKIESNKDIILDIGFQPSLTYVYFTTNGQFSMLRINGTSSITWFAHNNSSNSNYYGTYYGLSFSNNKVTITELRGRTDINSGDKVYWMAKL